MTRDEIARLWACFLGAFAGWMLILIGLGEMMTAVPPAACTMHAALRPTDPRALWVCITGSKR